MQASPQLATARSGARVCRWVGRWALILSSAGWFAMYSRGWLQPGTSPRCRYLTRFSTEYTEM